MITEPNPTGPGYITAMAHLSPFTKEDFKRIEELDRIASTRPDTKIEYCYKEFELSQKDEDLFKIDFDKAIAHEKDGDWKYIVPIIGFVCDKIKKTGNDVDKVTVILLDDDGNEGGSLDVNGWIEV